MFRRPVPLVAGGALVLALLLTPIALPAASPRWSYAGEQGPERWGSLDSDFAACASGHQQSPIDLTAAAPSDLPDPQIAYQASAGRIGDTGHGVQVDLEPGSWLTLDGTPYALLQFHFHSPSEHTINGSSFPAELHFVHRAETGALAVVGVFITVGAENPTVAALLSALPGKVGKEARLAEGVDPAALLPADRRTYRYAGSLTTPPCTERVSWLVMASPIQVSRTQISALARALHGNSRPVQPRQSRPLVLDTSP
ncbi:MAG TPA: carbonic anhydrase family protein [Thermoanaerobaculia bacterium]|jgi:carbonic anhydrase|nr:carbonic anhydrase family protein [Thermoanaerobaculia bacterium]